MASLSDRKMVGVSLKMYFGLEKTAEYILACTSLAPLALSHNIDIFLISDFLCLPAASTTLRLSAPTIRLGAQDCFWEDSGAYTGEISPLSLSQLGVGIVELGHAERRRLFGETDEMVAMKARAVERNGMVPLVCVGEKNKGGVDEVREEIQPQMEAVLAVTEGLVVFAYEPHWAIGQAEPAEAEYVVSVAKELRKVAGDRQVRILYGGSAGPGTYESMKEGVDGLFLGRFAHDIGNFKTVIEEIGR